MKIIVNGSVLAALLLYSITGAAARKDRDEPCNLSSDDLCFCRHMENKSNKRCNQFLPEDPDRIVAPTLSPSPCPNSVFTLELLTDDYGSETSWELEDTTANNVIAENGITYESNGTYVEEACLSAGPCFTFSIFDSFGDGICCSEGDGSYTTKVDGEVVGSGGNFTSVDTVDFCIGPPPPPTVSPAPTPAPTPCTNPLFTLELLTDNYGIETSWELEDTTANNLIAENGIAYESNGTYVEEACLSAGPCFTFSIFDSFGDGICCGEGDGSYTTKVDGEVVGSGGNFTFVDTVDFCIGPPPPPTVSPAPSLATLAPTPCLNPLFTLELLTDDYGSETSWELEDTTANNLIAENGTAYEDNGNYVEEACLSAGPCFTFSIFDSFGDGICCGEGDGSYTTKVDGEVVGSGGNFTFVDTVDFCIDAGGCEDSPLPISFQGPKTCEDVANFGVCDNSQAQSHCPATCNACNAYECADSVLPWIMFNQILTCSQLAGLPPGKIIEFCNDYPDLSATCRDTCMFCN